VIRDRRQEREPAVTVRGSARAALPRRAGPAGGAGGVTSGLSTGRFHRQKAHLLLSALRRRVAELACPYTAGYWWLLSRNEERLHGNVRMAHPVRGLRRLKDLDAIVEQEQHRASSPP
jgi:deoxyribodipyrimidine photolyase-like uncharacterized protein